MSVEEKYAWDFEAAKGTGASVVKLDEQTPETKPHPPRRRPPPPQLPTKQPNPGRRRRPPRPSKAVKSGDTRYVRRTNSSNTELGRITAFDLKAGLVTVRWLRSGRTSNHRLSEVARA